MRAPTPAAEPGESAKLADLATRFRELHRLSLVSSTDYAARYNDYLDTGRRLLGMSAGIVSHIEDGEYTILAVRAATPAFASGDVFPLSDTYCSWVLESRQSIAREEVGAVPGACQHPVYQQVGLEQYIAAPIWVDGEIYGTLNFTDESPRAEHFCQEDIELVEMMALGLGHVIEHDRLEYQRNLAVQRMQANVQMFESAFTHAAVGMALVSSEGRWLRINRSVCDILGYSEDELLSMDFQSITHPDDLDADVELVRSTLAGERDNYRMQKRYFRKGGEIVWVLLSVSLVRDADGTPRHFISQLQDITEQKHAQLQLELRQRELEAANDQLRELSTHDELTGLYNRRAYNQMLAAQLEGAERSRLPMSLVLIDIDHFKSYNDEYGHPEGDVALARVAEALMGVRRKNDVIARIGGEEFAALLPYTDATGSQVVGERYRQAVAAIAGLPRGITASVGASTYIPGGNHEAEPDARRLVQLADDALYRAKAEGRDRVVVGD